MAGIDLNDVATFVRVAEGEGFAAAARRLGVPTSTVSRAVARLEETLGVRLVHRTTRAHALTDAGRTYYERVRDAVAGVAEASAEVVDMGREPRGTIRVTAPPDVGQILLGEIIARFLAKYPLVRFEVSLTPRIVDLVAERFDLAVRASAMQDSTLVARKLGGAGLGLFASADYLRDRGAPASLGDLARHTLVGMGASLAGGVVLDGPRGRERVDLAPAVVTDDMLFVQRLVSSGAGIGLLPLFLSRCGARAQGQSLERVLPEWTVRGPGLAVVAPSARHEPRRVKLFREFFVAEAKRLGFG